MRKIFLAAFAGLVLAAPGLHAATISLVGDVDCFGIPGVATCPDGSLYATELGGEFFANYQDPGDLPFTDVWLDLGEVSFLHAYALPQDASSATLQLRIAGIHDVATDTPYPVLVNDVAVGLIPPNLGPNAFEEVQTYGFAVPIGLLTGSDLVRVLGLPGDGYIVDFSELVLTVPLPAPLPEPPAALLVALAGVAAAVTWRTRREPGRAPRSRVSRP